MATQLFNIEKIPTVAGDPRAEAPPSASSSVGVISAQQAAITFAGAPASVTLVWSVLGAAVPSLAESKLLAIALALIVGMVIYWQSEPIEGSTKQKACGAVFAVINSFAIAAATLGISSTTHSGGV